MTISLPWANAKQFVDSGIEFSFQETAIYYELVYFVGSTQYETKVDKTDPKNVDQILFETVYIPLASSKVFSEISFFPSSLAEKPTYSFSVSGFVPSLLATDIFTITGSALKTVKISRITISGTKTAHSHETFSLIKRSTLNTGGVFIARTAASHDSLSPSSLAVLRTYTTNPLVLGVSLGPIYSDNISLPVKTPSNAQGNGGSVVPWEWTKTSSGQPITLRGVTESLAINLAGLTLTGGVLNISIEWSEE